MFHTTQRRAGARSAVVVSRACLEILEDRRLLSTYTLEALDLTVSGDVLPGGLANNGVVVGQHDGPSGREVVVRRKSGQLETVPVAPPAQGMDVSESGDVVGYFGGGGGASGRRAFHYRNGTVTELPGFEGSTQTEANALNNDGDVVGLSQIPNDFTRAVIWRDGVPEFLGTLGGRFSIANDINNDGLVVGESAPAGAFLGHAFRYEGGQMQDLGVLNTLPSPFSFSNALAINDDGWIVGGSSSDTRSMEAFVYADGTMTGLGSLPGGRYSLAKDVNDWGVVVGESCGRPRTESRTSTPSSPALTFISGPR
jgi:probable HAF family extracellular repeat protein